jgi:hypothetical protein
MVNDRLSFTESTFITGKPCPLFWYSVHLFAASMCLHSKFPSLCLFTVNLPSRTSLKSRLVHWQRRKMVRYWETPGLPAVTTPAGASRLKLKLSYSGQDRPLGLQEVEVPSISRLSAHEGGKVVDPRHGPSLRHRSYPWYPFLLQAELTPGP